MTPLFRKEAVTRQRQPLLGDVVLAQPVSFTVFILFLVGIVVTLAVFLSLGNYARKETVRGFLTTDRGIVKVHAPRAGIVGELFGREGQIVAEGYPLLTLLGERVSVSGAVIDIEMLEAMDAQLEEIALRHSLETRQRDAQQKRLLAELDALVIERNTIEGQIYSQRQLIDSLQTNYDRIGVVVRDGYISAAEYLGRQENLLMNKQSLANLRKDHAVNMAKATQTNLALERLPLEHGEKLSKLASIRSDLELRRVDLSGRRSITITAPVPGEVTALQAIEGTSVDTRLPLLTILPEGGMLEAHLFIPTRAVGFVKLGQEVRLLYDAFDYRHFGVHSGIVSDISSSVFSPAETDDNIRISEPSYRVTVTIDKPVVDAYGQQFHLKAGMSLTADIVLDQRSLLQWLFEPFFRLKGRT